MFFSDKNCLLVKISTIKVYSLYKLIKQISLSYIVLSFLQYDHLEFPGVVPRTFFGPLVVAGIAYPIAEVLHYSHVSKFYLQILCKYFVHLFQQVFQQALQASK